MVTTKINRKSQIVFYRKTRQETCQEVLHSAAVRFTGSHSQQANLLRVFVHGAFPSVSSLAIKVPDLFRSA